MYSHFDMRLADAPARTELFPTELRVVCLFCLLGLALSAALMPHAAIDIGWLALLS